MAGKKETLRHECHVHPPELSMYLWYTCMHVPSGKLPQLLKMAIEIVSFPIKNGDFHSYVSLPEGITYTSLLVFIVYCTLLHGPHLFQTLQSRSPEKSTTASNMIMPGCRSETNQISYAKVYLITSQVYLQLFTGPCVCTIGPNLPFSRPCVFSRRGLMLIFQSGSGPCFGHLDQH